MPHHMYDAILAEPEAFRASMARSAEAARVFAAKLADRRLLYLVGTGSSFHVAQLGAFFFRALAPELPAHAVQAFEFAHYPPPVTSEDAVIVISHRGTKGYSVASTRLAREAGCATAVVTGLAEHSADRDGPDIPAAPSAAAHAEAVFETVAQERSSTHTVSLIAALAVLGSLARHAGAKGEGMTYADPFLHETLPSTLRDVLGLEPRMASLAAEIATARKIWLAGGGPAAVVAREAALKISESSYLQAQGWEVEELIHGPFRAAEPEDYFVLLAPDGPARARVLEFARQVDAIGARRVLFTDVLDGNAGAPEHRVTIPPLPEPFSAVALLVPLQLLAYHLALVRGTNPDSFRDDDPRFARASAALKL